MSHQLGLSDLRGYSIRAIHDAVEIVLNPNLIMFTVLFFKLLVFRNMLFLGEI